MVPGSTLMYGSSLMLVTRMPRNSRIAAREAAAMPFPREETTPPVTKTYFVIYPRRVGMEQFTGYAPAPLRSPARNLAGRRKVDAPTALAARRQRRRADGIARQAVREDGGSIAGRSGRHAVRDPASHLRCCNARAVHRDAGTAARARRKHAVANLRILAGRHRVRPGARGRGDRRPFRRVLGR